jgi:hypothetical protein
MYLMITYKTKLHVNSRWNVIKEHVRSYLEHYVKLQLNTITCITETHPDINVGKNYSPNQNKCHLYFLLIWITIVKLIKLLSINSPTFC